MLINNQFVFLPIPRNATTSMYRSLRAWNIPIDFGPKNVNIELKDNLITNHDTKHYHFNYNQLTEFFPEKKFISLYREPSDRFISGIYHFFYKILNDTSLKLKYNFLKFNTDDYIELFKDLMMDMNEYMKMGNFLKFNPFFNKYFINNKFDDNEFIKLKSSMCVFLSQYYYGIQYCDEIIPIENIKILEEKIKIIKPNFNLIKVNEKNLNLNLNIKKTDALIEFVNEYIDKPFFKIEKKENTIL
jgi:hypothetical protein